MSRLPPLKQYRNQVIAGAVLLAVLAPMVLARSWVFSVTLVFAFGILAFAAIVPIGYTGQLILSQGAFFGVGAYTYVKLAEGVVPSWVAVFIAIGFSTLVAFVLGRLAIRASGIYLGIITLAFNEIFVIFLDFFPSTLGGNQGLSVPELYVPDFIITAVGYEVVYYYILLVAFLAAFFSFGRVLCSPIGWGLLAIQEDITAAETVGVDTQKLRMLSFTWTGAICGLAGALSAPVYSYISPSLYNLHATIDIILAGVLGGITVSAGSILGASVVVLGPEVLRAISEIRMILYGVLLILLLICLPEGLGGWLKRFY